MSKWKFKPKRENGFQIDIFTLFIIFLFFAGPSQDVFLLPHIPSKGKEVVYF